MSTDAVTPGGPAVPEASPDFLLLQDLATILSGDKAAYLCLGPNGAVLSVKSPETFAVGASVEGNWVRMTPEARARVVLRWIRKAAAYYRDPKVRWALQREGVA